MRALVLAFGLLGCQPTTPAAPTATESKTAATTAAAAATMSLAQRMLDPQRDALLKPEWLIARLALSPAQTVADIGAGPGYLTLRLARAVPRGRVIATDLDGAALETLRKRAASASIGNIETRLVAAAEPGLSPGSVDVALLCHVDAFLPDPASWLVRLRPALRAKGRVVVIGYLTTLPRIREAATRAGYQIVEQSLDRLPAQFWLALTPPSETG